MAVATGDDLSNEDLDVAVGDDGRVMRATIDRPDKRNALNRNVITGLKGVMAAADEGSTSVVVVRGADGTFCSGADLEEGAQVRAEGDTRDVREYTAGLSEVLKGMTAASALTVAAVEGYCLAGGLGLAAGCDLVVAAEDAEFGTPEIDVGLFPAQALAPIMRTVPEKKGLKLLFTGERISAAEADGMGLLTDVVPPEEFDDHLDELVGDLAGKSPEVVATGKEAYYAQRDMTYDEALTYLKEVIALVSMS